MNKFSEGIIGFLIAVVVIVVAIVSCIVTIHTQNVNLEKYKIRMQVEQYQEPNWSE